MKTMRTIVALALSAVLAAACIDSPIRAGDPASDDEQTSPDARDEVRSRPDDSLECDGLITAEERSKTVIIIEKCPCGEYVPPSCPDCVPHCKPCSQ